MVLDERRTRREKSLRLNSKRTTNERIVSRKLYVFFFVRFRSICTFFYLLRSLFSLYHSLAYSNIYLYTHTTHKVDGRRHLNCMCYMRFSCISVAYWNRQSYEIEKRTSESESKSKLKTCGSFNFLFRTEYIHSLLVRMPLNYIDYHLWTYNFFSYTAKKVNVRRSKTLFRRSIYSRNGVNSV